MAKMKRKFGEWTVWDEAEHRADNFAKEWTKSIDELRTKAGMISVHDILRHGFVHGFINGFEHKFEQHNYGDDDGNTL